MNIFLDENMPTRLANAVSAIEGENSAVKVFHTGSYFGTGIPDTELIIKLKAKSGILITQDDHIRRNEGEMSLLRKEGVSVIIIGKSANTRFEALVQFFFKYWEDIKAECHKNKTPFVCKLLTNGEFKYYHQGESRK